MEFDFAMTIIEISMSSADRVETRENASERKEKQKNRLINIRKTPTRGIESRIIG
jgi:hypothetical protein